MQDTARLGCDLSYRDVPEHLFERSIDATYEAIHKWRARSARTAPIGCVATCHP